jgi:hypothetical protein
MTAGASEREHAAAALTAASAPPAFTMNFRRCTGIASFRENDESDP